MPDEIGIRRFRIRLQFSSLLMENHRLIREHVMNGYIFDQSNGEILQVILRQGKCRNVFAMLA